MLRLIASLDFKAGLAIDLSGNNNHGQTLNTASSSGPTAGTKSLYFNGNNSKVVIPTSDSFMNLGAVQIEADVKILEYGHRHNIVEGSASFAFFVNADGSIQGTVNDGTVSWRGLNSGSVKLPLNTWTNVRYLYDGFSSGRLYIDGNLVSSDFDMRVPLPNVNPSGVYIGNWPGGDGVYPMHGSMTNVKIWNLDRKVTSTGLYVGMQLDPARQDAWNQVVQYLNGEGNRDCFQRLLRFYENLVYTLRKDNPGVVNETDKFSMKFFKLLAANTSGSQLNTLIQNYFSFLAANVPATTWAALMAEAKAIEKTCFQNIKPSNPILAVATKAVDPNFQKLSMATTVAFRRTVLKRVDRELWPGGLATRGGVTGGSSRVAALARRKRGATSRKKTRRTTRRRR